MATGTLAEEIKRSKAADSLLDGDDPDPDISYAEQEEPEDKLPKIQSFDDYTSPKIYESPAEEGGGRYVLDQPGNIKVPYAELATEADKAAQPPGGVQLPKVTVTGEPEVRRAQLIDPDPDTAYLQGVEDTAGPEVRRAYQVGVVPKAGLVDSYAAELDRKGADPDPDNPDYKTPLTPDEETQFRKWVKTNNIPFDDSPTSDYDMRGFWKAAQEGDPTAKTSVSKFDGRIHFTDAYKTPFHRTFSNESQYATSNAPHWEGDRLIDRNGNVVADETPGTVRKVYPTDVGPPEPEVRRAARVGVTPKAELVDPDPDTAYLQGAQEAAKEPEVRKAYAPDVTPKAEPAPSQPSGFLGVTPTAPAVKPAEPIAPPVAPGPVKPGEPAPIAPGPIKQPQAVPLVAEKPVNPNGSDFPQRVQAVGDNDPAAFIVHHTSGRGTVDGVISTLRERGLGVQFVMDRQGNIFQTGGPGAQNILKGWGKGEGLSNQNVVGMEIIAKDDKDVTPAQAQAFARFIAARYPDTPLYGHGEVNPGHKEEDEGQTAKAAALAYRESGVTGAERPRFSGIQSFDDYTEKPQVATTAEGAAAKRAEPADKLPSGFYKDEDPKSFVTGTVTTFGDEEDRARYAQAKAAGLSDAEARVIGDNGQGAAKLGGLYTPDTYGVAIPREALIAQLGNNPAAWRKARVDVINTQTGQRMRVPIVDIGPGAGPQNQGVAADLTPNLAKLVGTNGRFAFKIVPNAGPDVNKNPDLWGSEQSAIAGGIDSSTIGRRKGALGINSRVVPDEELADVGKRRTALIEQQKSLIAKLPEQNQSLPALINRLDQPIEGVSEPARRAYQKAVVGEATKYAQDYYGIKDPKEAFAKIMSSPDIGTFFGEIKDKALPYLNQAVTAFNQSAAVIDQNRLDDLAKAVHPEASPQARKAFIDSIISEQDPAQRAAHINAIIGTLASENPNNPALAALRATDIADSAERLASPEYQKRQQEEIARQVDANTKALRPDPRLQGTAAGWWADQFAQLPKNVIEGITGPLGQSLMLSEIYQGTVTRLRQDNPNMSEDELKARAAGSTMAQIVPAEILNRLAGGKLGGLTGAIESPVRRIGLSALSHIGLGGTAGAAQQIGINVAEGRPTTEGVLQAAGAGAVQAAPGALISGIHGRAPVTEERPSIAEQPPITEPPPPINRAVRPADVLGPDIPDISMPWYKPGPIVTRAEERTAFSPAELAARVEELRQQGWTPSQIRQAMENLSPAPDFLRQTVHLGAEAQADLGPQPTMVTQEDVARRTYELNGERAKSGQPGTVLDDWTQAQKELSQAKEPIPPTQGESEPWVSAIANRHTAERAARGEVGEVIPGEGYSKEELLAKGLQMGPEQINQHVSDLMNNRGGDPKLQAAAVRAEEARLSQRSNAASRASEANPANAQLRIDANIAFQDLTDFHNGPVATLKNNWHAQGMTLQGEIPIDLSTFNGLRERFLRENGEAPPKNMEPLLRKTAKAVTESTTADRAAMHELGKEIERQSARRRLPTDEEVRNRIMEAVKDYPCRI